MEDPAMTAELTKQDAGAVERTDTQRFFALEQLTDQARLAEKQQRHAQLTAEANELEARRTTGFDGSSLNEKLPDLYARHEELLKEKPDGPELTQEVDAQIQAAAQALEQIRAREYQSQYTKQLADTQARIEGLRREVSRQRHILSGLKPGVQCPMCKQTVTEETLPQVRSLNTRKNVYRCNLCNARGNLDFRGPNAPRSGLCPICGCELDYDMPLALADGNHIDWTCQNCGATGKEGFQRVFTTHYDVCDGDGKPFPISND